MIYAFGRYELDTDLFELRHDGRPEKLEPQVFDLLRYLVEHRERLVSKQELLDAVWSDRFVSEATLSSRLMAARKAIGDSGRQQLAIRTTHGRGFRFVADVEERSVLVPPILAPPEPPPTDRPQTKYARSGSVNLAYQVVGAGPIDVVFVMGWVSHVEMFWTEPSFARFLRRIAGFSRLIVFDKRGTGLSDRVPLKDLPTLQQRMDDVRTVMQAAGSQRAVLIGVSEGAPMCVLFAATYPENCAGVVLLGGYARRLRAPDYPYGQTAEERERFIATVPSEWGGPVGLEARAPQMASDPAFREWWATYLRMGASPGAVTALMRMNDQIDVRDVLSSVRVPVLIIHRTDDRTATIEHARYMAARIPAAEFIELPGDDHLPFVGDQEEILQPIERFVQRLRADEVPEKVLSTVLAADVGPEQIPDVVKEVAWFHGEVRSAAGPLVATFDGPERAIRCGLSLAAAGAAVAVHTGECHLRDQRVVGPAPAAALEVLSMSASGEVLVSSATRALVAGSSLSFVSAQRGPVNGVAEIVLARA